MGNKLKKDLPSSYVKKREITGQKIG